MEFSNDLVEEGVRDRAFVLRVEDREVPGVLWTPAAPAEVRPLVLLGHGGGGHKRMGWMAGIGRRLALTHGIGAVAIDAVEHGDRRGGAILDREAAWAERQIRRMNPLEELYGQMIADWTAVLDELVALPEFGGPVGYFGLSMGTRYGIPYLAVEPRIEAAVLGLNGVAPREPENPDQEMVKRLHGAAAPKIGIPILWIMQQHDELFPRENALATFDLLGTTDKQLHMNPGKHGDVPWEELNAGVDFLAARLLRG